MALFLKRKCYGGCCDLRYLPRTLNEMFAELFLMLLVATQVMVPSSAFNAGEYVSTLPLMLTRPCSTSKFPSLSYLQVCNSVLYSYMFSSYSYVRTY